MAEIGRRSVFAGAAGPGLCLHPPGCCPEGAGCSMARGILLPTMTATTITAPPEGPEAATRRPLTIVYGDRACTVDVTETQALDIFLTARQVAEQSSLARGSSDREDRDGSGHVPATSCPGAAGSAYPPGTALAQSMKGSLRRFLEKRAARVRNTSGWPYATNAKLHSSP